MNNNALVTVVLCIVVFAVGFGLGRMTAGESAVDIADLNQGFTEQNQAGTDTASAQQEGTTVDTSNLTDGQRQMIEALGIDADSITITPQMIACAEAELGVARVEEIRNGATPSFSEGASLVACYR